MEKLKNQVDVLRYIALLRPNAHLAFLYHSEYEKLYNNRGQLVELMDTLFKCYYKKEKIYGKRIERMYYLYPRYDFIPYCILFSSNFEENESKSIVVYCINNKNLNIEAWEYLARHDLITKKGYFKEYIETDSMRAVGDCYLCTKSTFNQKSYIQICKCGTRYIHASCLYFRIDVCQICKITFKKYFKDTSSKNFLRRQTVMYLKQFENR